MIWWKKCEYDCVLLYFFTSLWYCFLLFFFLLYVKSISEIVRNLENYVKLFTAPEQFCNPFLFYVKSFQMLVIDPDSWILRISIFWAWANWNLSLCIFYCNFLLVISSIFRELNAKELQFDEKFYALRKNDELFTLIKFFFRQIKYFAIFFKKVRENGHVRTLISRY